MPSFTIGDFRIEVIDHTRSRFAVNGVGWVRESFIVEVFYQNAPLSLRPNETNADDFLGFPHRMYFNYSGREVVNRYDVDGNVIGTKRGADPRGRFWKSLVYSAGIAVLAARLGKTIGQVTEADIGRANNPNRDAMRGVFTEPTNLRTKTLDEAVTTLSGRVVS